MDKRNHPSIINTPAPVQFKDLDNVRKICVEPMLKVKWDKLNANNYQRPIT